MNRDRHIAKLRAAHQEHDTTGFNAFDFIHAFGSGREALMYAQLLWPEFLEFNDMVFLKASIDCDDDKRRIIEAFDRYHNDAVKTEQSFNLTEIPHLFGLRVDQTDEEEYRLLAEILCEMWRCRLRSLFPERLFQVEILDSEETGGELAVQFYQSRLVS